MRSLLLAASLSVVAGCASGQATAVTPAVPTLDRAGLLEDVRVLSADSMEGRRTGTPGGAKARAYVAAAFARAGLRPFEGGYTRGFSFATGRDSARVEGVNVVGYLEGSERRDRFIVVSAHYDHLGVQNGQIYNGADDNASGTAALIAIAEYFAAHRPRHSLIFAAMDAEESGLRGAQAFVATPPVARAAMVLDVNMDMVSHSERGELYAVGAHHYPAMRPYLERLAARAPVKLLLGHDSPALPAGDDWTNSSDHGAFHAVGIPFVYFGVEDHADYHRPSDDFATITPDFFVRAAETVSAFIADVDRGLDSAH
jgi:Zn-dependent M28 family amino/carboxypeptidase